MIVLSDIIGRPYTVAHDCRWLAQEITDRCGTAFPKLKSPESEEERLAMFQEQISMVCKKVDRPRPGDVAIFKVPKEDGKKAFHIGVILDHGRMITTTKKLGVHIVRIRRNNPIWRMWRLWLVGYYEVNCEEEE